MGCILLETFTTGNSLLSYFVTNSTSALDAHPEVMKETLNVVSVRMFFDVHVHVFAHDNAYAAIEPI